MLRTMDQTMAVMSSAMTAKEPPMTANPEPAGAARARRLGRRPDRRGRYGGA